MKNRTLRRVRNTAFSLLCCAAVILSGNTVYGPVPSVPSYADTQANLAQQIADADAKIKEIDEKIEAAGDSIEASKVQQDNYWNKLVATQEKIDLVNLMVTNKQAEIAAKEAEIADVEQRIADKELEIEDTELKIIDTEQKIAELDAQNRENIYRFGQIIKAMYMTDSDNYYLSVISGAEDFYDIFVRSEIMKNVSDQNLKFMNDLLDSIQFQEDVKTELGNIKVQLEDDKKQLANDKLTLESEKDTLEDEKYELDEQVKYYNDLNAGYWDEYNTYSVQIQDLKDRQANLQYQKKITQADRDKAQAALEEEIRRAEERKKHNTVYDTGEWQWPLDPQYHLITTYFGYSEFHGGNHGAIDIGNSGLMGANVYASKGGEVLVAKTTYIPGYDYGMYVVIDHGNGYKTLYAHLSAIYVSVGQVVEKGECIAAVGSTGWSTGPHLHFEVRQNDTRVDPLGIVAIPG